MANGNTETSNWTVDVQRGLAWTIILVFALLLVGLLARVIMTGQPTDALELLKQAVNALINIVMVVTGFFFGSSKSSQIKDETQAKLAEKALETTVVVAWWNLLTDEEKVAITEAAKADPKVAAFIAAATAGKATEDDLTYLVGKNLLTAQRAAAMKSL